MPPFRRKNVTSDFPLHQPFCAKIELKSGGVGYATFESEAEQVAWVRGADAALRKAGLGTATEFDTYGSVVFALVDS